VIMKRKLTRGPITGLSGKELLAGLDVKIPGPAALPLVKYRRKDRT